MDKLIDIQVLGSTVERQAREKCEFPNTPEDIWLILNIPNSLVFKSNLKPSDPFIPVPEWDESEINLLANLAEWIPGRLRILGKLGRIKIVENSTTEPEELTMIVLDSSGKLHRLSLSLNSEF